MTYGDVPFVAVTPELLSLIRFHGNPEDYVFQRPQWTGLGGRKADYAEQRSVGLGRLYWPTGASRWAIGHFVADSDQLAEMRALVKPTIASATAPVPLTFKMWDEDDPDSTVETSLYMLAPKPLFQYEGTTLWMVTLVDVRYYWWHKTADVFGVNIALTWAVAVSTIASALGETIAMSSVDSAYVACNSYVFSKYGYIPPTLDAIAYSIGRRIVRSLDGTVTLQTPDEAKAARAALLSTWRAKTLQGGSYAFGRDSEETADLDLWAVAPGSVAMTFPELDIKTSQSLNCLECCDEGVDVSQLSQTLETLALSDYHSVGQIEATKTVRSTAVRWRDVSTPQNDTELQTLVDQWATDWYKWRLGDQFRYFPTVVPWEGDGYADAVEWQAFPSFATRIDRSPLNDLADTVYHFTENDYGSGTCMDKIGCVHISEIEGYDVSVTQYLTHDTDGCLKWQIIA